MATLNIIIARVRIPEFRLRTCSKTFSVTVSALGVRKRFSIDLPYPCLQARSSELSIAANITYPDTRDPDEVKQIVNQCAQQAKDQAIQQLLIGLPLATLTGGSSVAIAIQRSLEVFRQSLTQCLRVRLEGLRPTIRFATPQRPISGWKRLF